MPQFEGRRAVSPAWYRRMVNELAGSVHAVHPDNVVIAGGLAPFGARTKFVEVVAPLRFMRELLCMSKGAAPRATCRDRIHLDAWAVQPYTSGGPTRQAANHDDLSLGDLPEARRLLNAAVKSGNVVSRQQVRFWATEFSWDTNPPDLHPHVVPIKLHARWVAEALYRMWKAGIDLVTWLQLRDAVYKPDSHAQSGLYFRGGESLTRDAPKPALAAFRFPFVAFRGKNRIDVWGRTPAARAARVVVEASSGGGWRRLTTLRADRYGIFTGRVRQPVRTAAPRPARARPSTYRQLVLRDAPSSYWPLDERSGSTARDLAGVRNARFIGAKPGVAGALLGTLGSAVSLDGKKDVVALGRVASPKTVEAWIKTQSTYEAAAFSNRDAKSQYTFLGVWEALRGRVFDSFGLSGRAWITDGRWHHLVYTYDGGSGRLYVDGVLDSVASFRRVEGAADAWVGYDATLKTHLRGAVDEVALYDYPLSGGQVREHFLASGRTLAYGSQFAIMGTGTYLRARLENGRGASLPFALARPPDRFVLPFGV
ncbi:MAG: LamG domain-containing protein [Actinobacteria bacterium]|nr:LamG domain-containing protein [Actinomycetota bacterium]